MSADRQQAERDADLYNKTAIERIEEHYRALQAEEAHKVLDELDVPRTVAFNTGLGSCSSYSYKLRERIEVLADRKSK